MDLIDQEEEGINRGGFPTLVSSLSLKVLPDLKLFLDIYGLVYFKVTYRGLRIFTQDPHHTTILSSKVRSR